MKKGKYKIRKMYFTYQGQTHEIWEIMSNKDKGPICKCDSLENAEFLLESLNSSQKKNCVGCVDQVPANQSHCITCCRFWDDHYRKKK